MLNDSATAQLYQRYAPAIFAYLRQHTASREDAEDALVEVFIAALESASLATLNEHEQQAWLWRVARNKIVDGYRRSHYRQHAPLELVVEMIDENDLLDPEQFALQQEQYHQLQAHLKQLPALQQEVFQLRFHHDLPCADIATRLGKREGTIRVILSRTLNLLRSIYEQNKRDNE